MKRYLAPALSLLLAFLLPTGAADATPNILFVIADQWRAQAFGYAGDLLQTLEQTGLSTNTIVVFTSDHGDMLWSQNQQRKQRPWEESARVPMLFRLPPSFGIQARRIDAMINSEDVLPTLLSLCGLPIPSSVEGFDFTGAMRGGPDPSGGATIVRCVTPFGEFIRGNGGREYRALLTPRYTYVRDLKGPWLLFNNVADPYQQTNLVGTVGVSELQAQLEARMDRKLKEQKDDFRAGQEYVKKWGYHVDATGTVPYKP